MMRFCLPLAILAALIGQSAFASTRLPDYGVTEIGNPGSGRYVFCTETTCPEPTIKHIAAPTAVVPPVFPLPLLQASKANPCLRRRRHRQAAAFASRAGSTWAPCAHCD